MLEKDDKSKREGGQNDQANDSENKVHGERSDPLSAHLNSETSGHLITDLAKIQTLRENHLHGRLPGR